jgi:phasin family protein
MLAIAVAVGLTGAGAMGGRAIDSIGVHPGGPMSAEVTVASVRWATQQGDSDCDLRAPTHRRSACTSRSLAVSPTRPTIRRSAMATQNKTGSAADFNPFSDLTKTFEQFKMPGVDMNAFVDARRKDVEALVAANKVAYEALQSLAKTQTDMLTQAMQGMQESARGAMAGKPQGGDMNSHTEAAQKAWQKMLTDMKELAEMVQKAQVEAMAGITERAKESIGGMKGLAHTK